MPWSDGECLDCGKYSGELYMLRNKLWKSLGLTPTDRLCLACLSKRLGRPFMAPDFMRLPLCNKEIIGVLAANEALKGRTRAQSETRYESAKDGFCSIALARSDLFEGAPIASIRACEYRDSMARETWPAVPHCFRIARHSD